MLSPRHPNYHDSVGIDPVSRSSLLEDLALAAIDDDLLETFRSVARYAR